MAVDNFSFMISKGREIILFLYIGIIFILYITSTFKSKIINQIFREFQKDRVVKIQILQKIGNIFERFFEK